MPTRGDEILAKPTNIAPSHQIYSLDLRPTTTTADNSRSSNNPANMTKINNGMYTVVLPDFCSAIPECLLMVERKTDS
jgi:hypothetical protein